jgi:hypothetical protein
MMKSKMMKITNMIRRLMSMKVIKMIKICMTQTGIFKMKKMRKMKIIFWMKDITGDGPWGRDVWQMYTSCLLHASMRTNYLFN